MRALQAASAGGGFSSLKKIASAVALTRDLIGMQSLPAVNAVLAALGEKASSLKDAGVDCSSLVRAGFIEAALKEAGFSIGDITFAGCMTDCCVVI